MTAPLIEINSVAILSGGESRRMGVDKAMLTVDGLPLIEKQVRNVRKAFGDIPLWVCSGPRRYPIIDDYNVTYLDDALPAGGPLAGIAQALHSASPEDGDEGRVLVIPCDTAREFAQTTPQWSLEEPLHSLYLRCRGLLDRHCTDAEIVRSLGRPTVKSAAEI